MVCFHLNDMHFFSRAFNDQRGAALPISVSLPINRVNRRGPNKPEAEQAT